VQLLHCLRAAGQGGDTGLVDGFAAAGPRGPVQPPVDGAAARAAGRDHRVLRRLSAGSPGRHLRGCYADLDGLASTLAVMKREEE
jgi:hypothetical protein